MIGSPPTSRGSPREVEPHHEPGENSNGTSGEDHSGINRRGAEHAIRPLAGFNGALQVDAYAALRRWPIPGALVVR
jgi:hypothetical protein